jgi:hypothetical protein
MRIQLAEEEDFPGQSELWAANVERSLKGKKGQAALRELEAALLALPEKRLIADHLEANGEVCALGALGRYKQTPLPAEPKHSDEYGEWQEDYEIEELMVNFGQSLGVPRLVAVEIVCRNDDKWLHNTPETRYQRMLSWTRKQLREPSEFRSPAAA